MIVRMIRVRLAGPRPLLDRTLMAVQDLGVLHLDRPRTVEERLPDRTLTRARRHIERCLSDVESAIDRLHVGGTASRETPRDSAPAAARRARRVRRRADALTRTAGTLDDERSLLLRYREFFQVFETFAGHELTWPDGQAFYVVLRAGAADALRELRRTLDEALDGEVELLHRELSSGEWAVLILTSAGAAPKVSALLSASRVEELPAPTGIGEKPVLGALPAITRRLAEITDELRALESERETMARTEGPWLSSVRAFLHDQSLRLEARSRVLAADYLFVIEGWLPASLLSDLEDRIRTAVGQDIVVSTLGSEEWRAQERAPVVLHNPPLFQPFEVLTRMLPLPKYGSVDPTPFVAIFFPAFFGLIVGDVGHALLLALLAGVLGAKSKPGSTARSLSSIGLACAASTAIFGFLFGEFFGSAGQALGLHPIFDREQAMIPFLALAVAIGAVHIVLGMLLASISAWRRGRRREAAGRSVMLGMLFLTALALLAAFEVLPAGLFTPLVSALLGAFVALVALEGVVAVIELVSTLGHILSYARIMALGTASVMLAVVANQMVGALGSVLIGVIFALLFHLVNFAIGVFSSTIHSLRLHYVEFFGAFFSPGGTQYRPLGHWHASP